MSVKFIKPKPIKINVVDQAIRAGLRAADEIARTDFGLGTGTWESENQPAWKVTGPKTRGKDLVLKRATKSTPFVWVDQGTKGPYPIPKSPPMPKGKFLRFQTGFIPKTKPGRLVAGPGAHFGPFALAKQVMHPGIEARDITGQVRDNADKHLRSLVQAEIDKVL